MVTAKEPHASQQFSAWNSSNLDQMALLRLEQSLPCFPPSMFTASASFPWQHAPDLCCFKGHENAVDGFANPRPPYLDISSGNPHHTGSQFALPHGIGVSNNKPVDASRLDWNDESISPQKRFLIFDQSGNHTRLFFSPSLSPQNQNFPFRTPTNGNGLCAKVNALVDQQLLSKPLAEEKWDENNLADGEGEMLEDSEEINALLYSDSNDESDDDDDGKKDEVNSTGHAPFGIEEGYKKDKLHEEVMEEVASSDGSPKRQRLLDGRYKKPSLVSVESPLKHVSSCSYEDDEAFSSAAPVNVYDDFDSINREKKVKIREALKTLESMIPGLNSKDPLSVIDKAITYFESMKTEAEALGLSYLECKYATAFP